MSLGHDDQLKFHDVEYDSSLAVQPKYYIENASRSSIMLTIMLIFVFIAVHLAAASYSPNIISYNRQYFALNKTDPNTTLELDLTLRPLIELNRFVFVNGSIIRNGTLDEERDLSVKFVKNVVLSKDAYEFKAEDHQKLVLHLKFGAGENSTEQFPLLAREIKYYDAIQIKISLTTDLTNIVGCEFTWAFSDPNGYQYSNSSRVLLALMAGYMLLLFYNTYKPTTDTFTQYFCFALGFAAIISSNPLNLFYPLISFVSILDSILISIFVAVLRIFVFSELDMIRTKEFKPNNLFLMGVSIFFALIAFVEATARLDRRIYNERASAYLNVVLPIENYLIYLDILYVAFNVILVIVAFVKSSPSRKLYFLALISFLQCFAVLFSQVFCVLQGVLMFSIMPFILYISVNMTTSAFTIYAFQNCDKPFYTQIEGEQNGAILELERASDSDFAVNDEEEEEEEE